jgi:urea transporter/murein DD-endopeptidase MepM/ murein hydrolase activator NlpD
MPKQSLNTVFDALLLSFSQVFFANKKWFGLCLLLLIALFPIKFLVTITSVIFSILLSYLFNFDKTLTNSGVFTFNTVLVALGLSTKFDLTKEFLFLFVLFSSISLLLSVWLFYYFAKKGLPFLVLPFLICLYLLNINQFSFGTINQHTPVEGLFVLQQLSHHFSAFLDHLPLGDYFRILLNSLSAILFVSNELIGFLLLCIIFIYSRINFLLVIFGFTIGLSFYTIFLGDFKDLIFSYIGFNFILVVMALGGFFIIPSTKNFAFQFFTISLTCLLIGALNPLFLKFNTPLYSLPFVLVVLLILSVLKYREKSNGLELVTNQQSRPEDNLYKNYYTILRFKANTYFHVYLPILGEWRVSQGIDGKQTHLGDWKYAYDFDMVDSQNRTYRNYGIELKDFYAYETPIISPVSGYVANLLDHVLDNPIGEIDALHNFGNTIVIKIAENFYLKLSHLLAGSIKVGLGDYVYVGQTIALCGNSGRSPEPHVHMQFQITPDIGAKTVKYPFAYFLTKEENHYQFNAFDYPKQNTLVKNIMPCSLLKNAYKFLPDHEMEWLITSNNKTYNKTWYFGIDAFNKAFILDKASGDLAYFKNDGVLFYFYDYLGGKDSELFLFYLANQKVLLGAYKKVAIEDWIIPSYVMQKNIQWLFDLIAPFKQLIKVKYTSQYDIFDNENQPNKAVLNANILSQYFNKSKVFLSAETTIANQKIESVSILKNNQTLFMQCTKVSSLYS